MKLKKQKLWLLKLKKLIRVKPKRNKIKLKHQDSGIGLMYI